MWKGGPHFKSKTLDEEFRYFLLPEGQPCTSIDSVKIDRDRHFFDTDLYGPSEELQTSSVHQVLEDLNH